MTTTVNVLDDYHASIAAQQPVMTTYALFQQPAPVAEVVPEVPDEVPAEVEGDKVEAKVVKAPAKTAAKRTEGVEVK